LEELFKCVHGEQIEMFKKFIDHHFLIKYSGKIETIILSQTNIPNNRKIKKINLLIAFALLHVFSPFRELVKKLGAEIKIIQNLSGMNLIIL